MKKNEQHVKICPKCGSTNLKPFGTTPATSFGETLKDFCQECNYGYPNGGIFPEIKMSEVDKFRKKIKK